jgi:hypothetical protein
MNACRDLTLNEGWAYEEVSPNRIQGRSEFGAVPAAGAGGITGVETRVGAAP